jgi:uncharacterized protein DUF1566
MRAHTCGAFAFLLLGAWPMHAIAECCGDCDGNGSVAINELITAVNNALGECETGGCGVPATGQQTSYGPGSDGEVRAGVPLSATDNGDGTITDTTTGLMWEKKDDAGGIHDKDNAYTWGMGDPPYTMNGTMVTEFLPALNTPPCFADHCDWRIPNVRELQSLVDYEMDQPAVRAPFSRNCAGGCTVDGIDGPTCSCIKRAGYWSSTTFQSTTPGSVPSFAWYVEFVLGSVGTHTKRDVGYVRAVRGGL